MKRRSRANQDELSPTAHRRALRLHLERLQRKITRVEKELAEASKPAPSNPDLFTQATPAAQALRDRLEHLQRLAAEIEAQLRVGVGTVRKSAQNAR